MNIFQRIGAGITKPSELFDEVAGEGIGPAFAYLAVVQWILFIFAIPTVLVMVILVKLLPFVPFEFAVGPLGIFTVKLAVASIGAYLFILLFSFLGAGVFHLWCLLWGAIGDYADSYKIIVYSATPFFVFGWIPGINLLVLVWRFVLVGVGLVKIHYLSATKAVFMILIPLILVGLGVGTYVYFW